MLSSALRTPRARGARGAVDAAVPTAGALGWIRGRSSQLSSSSILGITLAQISVCVLCVCFSLLLMHEALTSRPRCASDADQQQPLNQTFPLSTVQSLCSSPYLSWKQPDLCKWNSSLGWALLPLQFLPAAAGSFLWKMAKDRSSPPINV